MLPRVFVRTVLACVLVPLNLCVAWIGPQVLRLSPRLVPKEPSNHGLKISNIFGGVSGEKKIPALPKDVKEAVTKCREATQEALKNRKSRMGIEFPVGTKFSVEQVPKRKKRAEKGVPTADELMRSDRELARLFVDMFQPVNEGTIAKISVVFNDLDAAELARRKWKGDPTAQCRVLSMDRRKSSKSKKKAAAKKAKGFAAKLAQEMDDDASSPSASGPFQLPDTTEVALFVAPGPKELIIVEKICDQVGMGTLVVLLNARTLRSTGSAQDNMFGYEFESVFHLGAAPQDVAPNCLMYRTYPGKWVLARKLAVGQPQPILVVDDRPTPAECQDAFDGLELSPVEKNVESALENVAGWFA